jgi:predicted nuclease of predicted toxin-antitoxin system
MLRLISDGDFNGKVIRGLFRRQPELDLIRVHDIGLRTADDPTILEWAAKNGRIVLTHDRNTMTRYANERVENGDPMPGVFVIRDEPPFGAMIEEILLVDFCSTQDEWIDRIEFLPL